MQRPFPAYQGDEPYVFVSYAHDDAPVVYPEISRLRDQGFNIWYDEGIEPGSRTVSSTEQDRPIRVVPIRLFLDPGPQPTLAPIKEG